MIEEKVVREALQTILHPKLKKSLIEIGMIPDFSIKGDAVTVTLALLSNRFLTY
jgi:metal-sulfur cluster biosynthetic enzyme